METQPQANNMPLSVNTEHADRETRTSTSDSATNSEEEEEELMKVNEWSENELQTPSPTMQQDSTLSGELCEDEETAEVCHHLLTEQPRWPEGTEDASLSGEKDHGKCSPEELLQETAESLRTEMENMLTEIWTGESDG